MKVGKGGPIDFPRPVGESRPSFAAKLTTPNFAFVRTGFGSGLAKSVWRDWVRKPGEKRIPKSLLKKVLNELPEGDWEDGPLTELQVAEYCAALGKGSGDARLLVAGKSGAQVFSYHQSIFKMFGNVEEMLQDVVALEVIASLPGNSLKAVSVEHAGSAFAGSNAFAVMSKANGTVLFDRMDQVAAARDVERSVLFRTLTEELVCAGKAMARFHDAARSGTEMSLEHKQASVSRIAVLLEAACRSSKTGPLRIPALQQQAQKHLRELSANFMNARLEGTISIGDIHPGNIAVHHGECTVFDVSTLVSSLGARGEGLASAADDRMWFAETIPWYGRQIGFSESECALATTAYLNAYTSNSALAGGKEDQTAVQLFRLRSALTDLRCNPDSPGELARALAQLGLRL